MAELDDFAPYASLADQLIERATKEQLADVAKLLAISIGWYQQKHGDVPQDVCCRHAELCTWISKLWSCSQMGCKTSSPLCSTSRD